MSVITPLRTLGRDGISVHTLSWLFEIMYIFSGYRRGACMLVWPHCKFTNDVLHCPYSSRLIYGSDE